MFPASYLLECQEEYPLRLGPRVLAPRSPVEFHLPEAPSLVPSREQPEHAKQPEQPLYFESQTAEDPDLDLL